MGDVTACGLDWKKWLPALPGVNGCLRLASSKWSPMFPRCGPVLFYPVRSCPLMSCPVLSCPMPLSPGMSCLVFSWMSFSFSYSSCFCCFPLSLFSLLSLCLSRLLVFFSSFCLYSCFRSTRCRGLTFTSVRVLVSSTCRQSRLAHRSNEPHTVHSVLSRPLYPCSHRMCIIAWAVSRSSHKQNNDMANYGISSCKEEPPGRSEETASHSAPASLTVTFRIPPFFHRVLGGVQTVSQLFPGCVPFP